MKVGNFYKCPEGHRAIIVWISENEKVIAIKCPYKHFDKIVKLSDYTKPGQSSRNYIAEERKIYTKDVVFLIRI